MSWTWILIPGAAIKQIEIAEERCCCWRLLGFAICSFTCILDVDSSSIHHSPWRPSCLSRVASSFHREKIIQSLSLTVSSCVLRWHIHCYFFRKYDTYSIRGRWLEFSIRSYANSVNTKIPRHARRMHFKIVLTFWILYTTLVIHKKIFKVQLCKNIDIFHKIAWVVLCCVLCVALLIEIISLDVVSSGWCLDVKHHPEIWYHNTPEI